MVAVQERLSAALADRYRIEGEAGRGGMATVYIARDLKNPRRVAIKVLNEELASAIGVERFLREIKTAAGLTHPHILPLFDSDQADGLLFYVMPYIEGETLRDRLQRERQLPIADAIRIACEVADALAYAHSLGVVHRDIKPENILFQAGHAMVSDFGIARAISTAGGDVLTGTGTLIGTPGYMSPEQVEHGASVDGRSDTYSLACMLYEMLGGDRPFLGWSAQAILARQLLEPVPSLRTVRDMVPPEVERAILRALAKVPADRFATTAQFAEALVSRESPIADSAYEDSIAVLPFANPDPETEYFSDGITEEISNALARIPGLKVAARTSSFAFRGKAVDLAEVGAKLKVATVLEGSVRKAGSRLRVTVQLINVADGYQLWSERYDREMTDVFALQDEIGKAIADRLQVTFLATSGGPLVTPATANLDAYHLYLKGRYFWAQRGLGLKHAVDCFNQALALDPNYALAHAGLADAYTLLAEYGMVPPNVILPQVRAAIERALALAPQLAEAHCASGELKLVFDWDWPHAARSLRRAIELNPHYVAARYRLALYLSLVEGLFEEALDQARRAVELDPLAPLPVAQLGVVLLAAGRHEEAIVALRRSVELAPGMFVPHLHLGVIYNHLGQIEQALASLEVAAAVSGRHPSALTALAACFRSLGKTADVLAIYEELAARGRREYVSASSLALAAAAAGRVDEAFQLLDRGCVDRDSILIYAKRHPAFGLLQADPRMPQLLRRIGFPE
jgi:TolB-like protein/Tfp pilus assembly protein PilF